MRVLLSTIGSRGDVQPVVALAVRLASLGQDVLLCAPPDFREHVEGLGITFTPVGPELRATGKANPAAAVPTPEQRRQLIEGTLAAQFEAVTAAAKGCDVILAGGYLVIAARTIAESQGSRYVFAGYSPNFLPSPRHAPPVYPMLGQKPADGSVDNSTLWAQDAERWNSLWGELLNAHRAAAGLAPVTDVRSHLFTETPWLAADPTLGPWSGDLDVVQTGAWILPDERPLSPELESFLAAGEPPVYFGFGSIRAPRDLSRDMISAARALGRRAVVLRGWAELELLDDDPDCVSIGEVNQQALFQRVAAVVHHGGAGTTTAAARAGAPQVVLPQHTDQHYWAQRVAELGIGAVSTTLTEALLTEALRPDVVARAKALAPAIRTDGTAVAADLLLAG